MGKHFVSKTLLTGKDILSNPLGMPGPPTLGLNTDWCITLQFLPPPPSPRFPTQVTVAIMLIKQNVNNDFLYMYKQTVTCLDVLLLASHWLLTCPRAPVQPASRVKSVVFLHIKVLHSLDGQFLISSNVCP